MTAILRVKRKNTNAPLDTLVIACKRLKTSSDTSPVETVLQFAGTLTDPVRMIFSLLLFFVNAINYDFITCFFLYSTEKV